MEVKVPTAMRTPEDLSEGYSYCGLKFIDISLKKLYRSKDMLSDTDVWKAMFVLDLPYSELP